MITHTSRVLLVLLLLIASLTASVADSAKDKLAAGRIDEAITELNGRLSSSPADAESSNLLCRAYFALEDWNRAESSCRKAASLDPDNSRFHLWLGRVYGEKADRANFLAAAGVGGEGRGGGGARVRRKSGSRKFPGCGGSGRKGSRRVRARGAAESARRRRAARSGGVLS